MTVYPFVSGTNQQLYLSFTWAEIDALGAVDYNSNNVCQN